MKGSNKAAALPAGVSLREATELDIAAMVEVVNAAFEEESFFVNGPRTDPAQLAERFRNGHFLLAHKDGLLVASAYYQVHGEHGYIGMLAVRPGHQRGGLGSAVLHAAEGILREAGCRVAELTVVHLRTKLLDAYRRLGYREVGVEEAPEDLRHRLTMPAHLIKLEKQL
jgi:ribosomal protein S18 acetylase RimI-like enzyme